MQVGLGHQVFSLVTLHREDQEGRAKAKHLFSSRELKESVHPREKGHLE